MHQHTRAIIGSAMFKKIYKSSGVETASSADIEQDQGETCEAPSDGEALLSLAAATAATSRPMS